MSYAEVKVKLAARSYVTSTVLGERASSTESSGRAVEALGRKLFGSAFERAEERARVPGEGEFWRIHFKEASNADSTHRH